MPRANCIKCDKPLDGAHKTYCKACHATVARENRAKRGNAHNVYMMDWRKKNPEKTKAIRRRALLKSMYGLTVEEYDAMLTAQDGKCAICEQLPSASQPRLFVDHNHFTGNVRGLLCSKCNFAVGLLGEDMKTVERLSAYLIRHNDETKPSEGGS